jgi:pyruvate formate lyase activating enzyme
MFGRLAIRLSEQDSTALYPALLGEAEAGGRVRCRLCARLCSLPEGKVGYCGVRINKKGRLYSLNYGRLVAMHADPIEKKPLNHFHPGSYVFSIATVGCNFACQYCQNYDISQRRIVQEPYTPIQRILEFTRAYHCQGITGTYNEPTIEAEYLIDLMKEAKKKGYFTTWVSNGYLTPEAVDLIAPHLDAITVDFKGSGNEDFYRRYILVPSAEPIFETLKLLKMKGVHIEVTDLIVPVPTGAEIEDITKLAAWITANLGEGTPFHLLRFHPDYRMLDIPSTPFEVLKKGLKAAKEAGLKHVYLGNVPDGEYENTTCPFCGALCIERRGFWLVSNRLKNGNQCPSCGHKLNIVP